MSYEYVPEKDRPWYYWFTYLWTSAWDLTVCWPATLLIWLFFGKKLFWLEGLWCVLDEKSWFVCGPYKNWEGTTLGHGGWIRESVVGENIEEVDTGTEFHEIKVHIEQFCAAMLRSILVALLVVCVTFNWVLALIIWWMGYLMMGVANWLQAIIRGEPAYMGSHHEESAYAQTEIWEKNQKE